VVMGLCASGTDPVRSDCFKPRRELSWVRVRLLAHTIWKNYENGIAVRGLLVPQSRHRINSGRSPCRRIASENRAA
jgi:hypothetical protein